MNSKYTNVSLPQDLIDEIDKIVASNTLGYQSRADFCKDAIRTAIKDIRKGQSPREKIDRD